MLDPLLLGAYPEALEELWAGVLAPRCATATWRLISTPISTTSASTSTSRANVSSDGGAHGYVDKGLDRVTNAR